MIETIVTPDRDGRDAETLARGEAARAALEKAMHDAGWRMSAVTLEPVTIFDGAPCEQHVLVSCEACRCVRRRRGVRLTIRNRDGDGTGYEQRIVEL